MTYETLIYEKQKNIGYITFNRPEKMNYFDQKVAPELNQALDEVEKDPEVRVLIITGAGKAFSAGGDIPWLEKGTKAPYEFYSEHDKIMRVLLRIERLTIPVIAAINGYAFGGGMELLTACDIRVASENAKMGMTEVTLGIMPGAGGTARLPRIVGKAKALELELTGEQITAREAYEIGLLNKVVLEGEAVKAAEEIANKIIKNAPQAVRQIKNAIQMGMDMSLEGATEYCQKNCMMTIATQDGTEGLNAWSEKRSPVWKGK